MKYIFLFLLIASHVNISAMCSLTLLRGITSCNKAPLRTLASNQLHGIPRELQKLTPNPLTSPTTEQELWEAQFDNPLSSPVKVTPEQELWEAQFDNPLSSPAKVTPEQELWEAQFDNPLSSPAKITPKQELGKTQFDSVRSLFKQLLLKLQS